MTQTTLPSPNPITDDQRHSYQKNGHLLVESYIPPGEAERLFAAPRLSSALAPPGLCSAKCSDMIWSLEVIVRQREELLEGGVSKG